MATNSKKSMQRSHCHYHAYAKIVSLANDTNTKTAVWFGMAHCCVVHTACATRAVSPVAAKNCADTKNAYTIADNANVANTVNSYAFAQTTTARTRMYVLTVIRTHATAQNVTNSASVAKLFVSI